MVLSWNREGSVLAKRVRTTQWGIKKNYIVTQPISADPQAVNNYWSFTVLSFLFYLPSALLTKITSRQTFLS